MRELLRLRRRFFSRAWAVFAGSLALLFGWAALFRDTFGTMIGGSLSLGLLIGLAYVAVVFALTVGYARRAREWDGLIARMLDSHRPAPSRSEA